MSNPNVLIKIPENELKPFMKMVIEYRKKHIRTSSELVDEMFKEKDFSKDFSEERISEIIEKARESVWEKFLVEESNFNARIMQDLHERLATPNAILDNLLTKNVIEKDGDDLKLAIKELCGEYAGRVYPYIYALALSNTNSRRSRAGKTFEAIIYKMYEVLDYPFDSQGKVGRKIFDEVGLGKKVDSVLPSIEAFKMRRNRTIIGTMKTTLRERWQEVAEEIERTKIPEIHLLTVDDHIALSKAKEMSNHNIVIVGPKKLAESKDLKGLKNIISFEEYFYEEIPKYLEYWKKDEKEV